jgi:hypothetical protein
VAVDTSGSRWADRAEAALRELRDVHGVSLQMHGEKVSEIHVETRSKRPAKQIVRDVQTILRTRFGHQIDHRVVSVAYTDDPAARGPERVAEAVPAPPKPAPEPAPAVREAGPAQGPQGAPAAAVDDRVRFESANLYVSGPRVQAQVELRWKGLARVGTASGLTSRDASDDLVASAAVAALQEFLEEDVGLGRASVADLRLGRHEVKIVAVPLVAHRMEKMLVGSCTVEQDAPQAVVLATLAALNRVLGGLRTREPIEYVLRPASREEASGAKRE